MTRRRIGVLIGRYRSASLDDVESGREPARENWMFERLFGDRRGDPALAERVPPSQYLTEKFPVLHYGSVPKVNLATWDFRVYGEVDNLLKLTWTEFQACPAKTSRPTSTA